MVKKISEKDYAAMDKSGLKVIDFSATWCGPCRMLVPVLEQVSEKYDGSVEFYNVDVDESPKLAEEFNIMSVPAVFFIKDGAVAGSNIGFVPADKITELVEQYK